MMYNQERTHQKNLIKLKLEFVKSLFAKQQRGVNYNLRGRVRTFYVDLNGKSWAKPATHGHR